MTSEPLEVQVLVVFDYCAAYLGGEKIKIDRPKRHTQTDGIKLMTINDLPLSGNDSCMNLEIIANLSSCHNI